MVNAMRIPKLTNGEKLLVQRRRDDLTQPQAAEAADVSLYLWRKWEIDIGEPPSVVTGRLLPHEACFIRRRRAGVSLASLADALKLSRWWICQMEYGRAPIGRLVAYWSKIDQPWRGGVTVKA